MKKILLLLLAIGLIPLLSNAQCVISAGSDLTICSTQSSFPIQGTATQFTTYLWSTSGTGSFMTTTNLGTVYSPSPADITAGSVTLSLSGSGGSCTAKTATVLITINPVPSISAGADQTSCSNVQMTASISGGATLAWSTASGSGTFTNPSSANSLYYPSQADLTNGSVTLTATATSAGACTSSDQVVITFIASPSVNAGLDLTSCLNSPVSLINATVTNATTYLWSTSGTGTFSSTTVLHPTYQPSAADITASNVVLTLTATSSGGCTASDALTVSIINSGASVNAGADQSMCGNSVQLNATFSGAGGVVWTSSGSGTFSSTTIANPTYSPSQAERTAGIATLTATTTSNGSCPAASDQLIVTINARVRLIAGPAITVCPNAPAFPTVAVDAGTVTWTSSGTGSFTNATSLTPTYVPSAADYTAGQVTLNVTSSTNGSCPSESGTVAVTFTGATAAANAGLDVTTCKSYVNLNGTVTNATGGIWTTTGTGTFAPSAQYLNTTYSFSNSDANIGSVTFTLTTTGTCGTSVSDQVTVTVASATSPNVYAGLDQVITGTTVSLSGAVSSASGALWTSSGTGTFSSATSLSATYTPSAQDIVNGLVKLTLTSTGNGVCAAASDNMYVTIGNTFTLSGVIQAATNALDEGVVLIYKKENTTVRLIQKIDLAASDAGAYSAENLPAGNYIVFATPTRTSTFANTFLPTYSGGVQKWDQAQVFSLTSNTTKNIPLTAYTSADPTWDTGNDVIAGIVYLSGSGQVLLRTTATANQVPAANTTVYLTNASGATVAYTLTDSEGKYEFTDVVAGKYRAVPELGGTAISGTQGYVQVVTDGSSSTVEDASINIEERTSSSTGVLYAKTLNLNTYPNPATTRISFDLVSSNVTGTVKLLNQAGVVQLQQQVDLSTSTVTLDIEKIAAGIYILQVTSADEVYTSKVIKY
ncbi:beta strand repeat-containing protein [Cytophaga aurantiaca]|uniref:beta strand repeat-containing protein n=1 Tax=Cytophaga aurantiaca TaxID=29530 RepID=UPI000369620D|nr:T9SS type A sorting domain-containing protein [Cytophaga aurantiaca]